MAIDPVGGLERKERSDPQDHWAHDLVSNVEVIVHESAALRSENTVIGIVRGILGRRGTKRGALFHASINEINPVSIFALHAPEPGQNVVLFANAFLRPFDLDRMIAGEGINPVTVILRSLTEDFFGNGRHVQDLAEEVNGLLRPGETAEVSIDDNTVEAVIYKYE